MNSKHLIAAASLFAACGADAAGLPEVDADAHDASDSEAVVGLDVETNDALEAAGPAFAIGRPFEFSSGSFSYGIALDTPMWIVPIDAAGASVTATNGETTIEILGASTSTRVALMPVSIDGTPGPAKVIAEDTYYPGLGLLPCGDDLWTAYQQSDRVSHFERVPFVDGVFGEPERIELVRTLGEPGTSGFGVNFAGALCIGGRVIVSVSTDNCLADVAVGGRTVGEIGNLVGHQVSTIDATALLDRGELVMSAGGYASASSVGRDGTVLVSRTHVLGPDAVGQYDYEHTLERVTLDDSPDTRLIDHVFTSEPRVLVESAAGTIVTCGFGTDEDFGNGATTTAAAGPYCLGIVDGRATWVTTLGPSIVPAGTLVNDTLWLTTGVPTSDASEMGVGFEGTLIGLDPDTGAIIARAVHRIAGSTLPSSTPRMMVGEGPCAGVRGVGVTMANRDPDEGTLTFERVIAGPDGMTCVEPLATLSNVTGAIRVESMLVEPPPGPCAERPHLALLRPGDFRLVNESEGELTYVPDDRHASVLMTVRANDCAIGIESPTVTEDP